MAKAKTIEEKRKEMEQALARLGAFEVIIERLESVAECNYGNWAIDPETNEWAFDDDGNHIYAYPKEGDWNYSEYKAMLAAIDEIKALV